jgi:hypothetical protein
VFIFTKPTATVLEHALSWSVVALGMLVTTDTVTQVAVKWVSTIKSMNKSFTKVNPSIHYRWFKYQSIVLYYLLALSHIDHRNKTWIQRLCFILYQETYSPSPGKLMSHLIQITPHWIDEMYIDDGGQYIKYPFFFFVLWHIAIWCFYTYFCNISDGGEVYGFGGR